VASEVADALQGANIDVMASPSGYVLGRDEQVRVFGSQHIKGVEFKAASFHSLQDLARDAPGLVGKYLYVGATRAATFLGLACDGAFAKPCAHPEVLR
jgi:hypothetical protein